MAQSPRSRVLGFFDISKAQLPRILIIYRFTILIYMFSDIFFECHKEGLEFSACHLDVKFDPGFYYHHLSPFEECVLLLSLDS